MASPRGSLSEKDLAGLDPERRRRLLERNPQLAEELRRRGQAAGGGAAARGRAKERPPARPEPGTQAARIPAKDIRRVAQDEDEAAAKERSARKQAGERQSAARRARAARAGRRIARRTIRETPGAGPSVTNLLLGLAGTTLLVIGLSLVLTRRGSDWFESVPSGLSRAVERLVDPTDPIF